MRILSFDTASKGCFVSLWENGAPLISLYEDIERGQGERLPLMVQKILAHTGFSLSDLDLLLTNLGPGSFTGIRVALSFGYGLSEASGIPLKGYNAFQICLKGYEEPIPSPYVIILDAKRRDMYVQFHDGSEIFSLTPEELSNRLQGYILIGDGVDQVKNVTPDAVAYKEPVWRGADALALCYFHNPEAAQRPEPFYVRSADVSYPKA